MFLSSEELIIINIILGSSAAVASAQRTIGDALENLNKSIEAAESLKSSALSEFAGHTTQLLEIMGPETAKYVEQKVEIENLLRLEYEKEQKLHEEIARKKGKLFFKLNADVIMCLRIFLSNKYLDLKLKFICRRSRTL